MRKWILTLPVVWATIVSLMSSVVCPADVKWRETVLTSFPCLMSARCLHSRSLNVLPVQHTGVHIFCS